MFLVFGSEHIEELAKRHVTLELETFDVGDAPITVWCIITAETLAVGEYPDIERLSGLHKHFIDNYNRQDYDQALQALPHLRGRWNGELDSFYSIMEQRITEAIMAKEESNGSE